MRWSLGVTATVYGDLPIRRAAELAREDGFEHIDALHDAPDGMALPVGDRFSMRPQAGCTAGPAPAEARTWEKTVEDFRRVAGARMEPWPGSVVGDNDAVRAMLEAVPGLRLTLDVGHVTAWGGDPIELLAYADHVQLRQARVGATQTRDGIVDFARVLETLASLDYAGRLSVEYFDLPERGWGFDDPRGAALETAREIRALLA